MGLAPHIIYREWNYSNILKRDCPQRAALGLPRCLFPGTLHAALPGLQTWTHQCFCGHTYSLHPLQVSDGLGWPSTAISSWQLPFAAEVREPIISWVPRTSPSTAQAPSSRKLSPWPTGNQEEQHHLLEMPNFRPSPRPTGSESAWYQDSLLFLHK